MMTHAARVLMLVNETQTAYSFERWGVSKWALAIERLVTVGLSDRAIIVVMESKLTRWAADNGRHQMLASLCTMALRPGLINELLAE